MGSVVEGLGFGRLFVDSDDVGSRDADRPAQAGADAEGLVVQEDGPQMRGPVIGQEPEQAVYRQDGEEPGGSGAPARDEDMDGDHLGDRDDQKGEKEGSVALLSRP